ncbi:MAG: hypothetical protein GF364_08050 [Candidatus Lokiarchaeota archaeon]|nr:hypothetical protein [Candidatus Lokiarchaeota archaeon]
MDLYSETCKTINFALFFDNLPHCSKKEVNNGLIPNTLITITSYLRSIFLTSNNIRTKNNLYIFFKKQFSDWKKGLIVKVLGQKLRYLSPDERVTILILQKIIKIASGTSKKKHDQSEIKKFKKNVWAQSTPGILLKKGDINDFFSEISSNLGIKNPDIILSANKPENKTTNTLVKHTESAFYNDLFDLSHDIIDESIIINEYAKNSSYLEQLIKYFPKSKIRVYSNEEIRKSFFDWQILCILQALNENR